MATQNFQSHEPDVRKEIRFAVVMYGGVSLAIYINGVAQELYKMVRATARKRNKDGSFGGYVIEKPTSTETVYRRLGELLQARIVVDILSGTSAGGINAIYLAKALANDQPMSQLEELWIDQGDIQLLINDRDSVKGIKDLNYQPPPNSLLNSQRMYYQLLKAFDEMDEAAPRVKEDLSPFVDELDLYVTTTDIRGLWLPVPLADAQAHEYRYRTVFRFYYSPADTPGESSQDFSRENNPFLAFAARSTSSFPLAFEPIKIEDVGAVLGKHRFVRNYNYIELSKEWNRFYRDYHGRDEDSFEAHSFGDGGYLDNKPFSYITETLQRRRADTPVDRRLFYIEPAPERSKQSTADQMDRPDAVENVVAALVKLPRYETIRDDLLQIQARNELIERIGTILRQIERSRGSASDLKAWLTTGLQWSDQYLDQIVSRYGYGYAAYHQLRVADTLDDFAGAVARNIGLEEEGQAYQALRQLFEEWRKRTYSTRSTKNGDRPSENDLLFRMDLRWRVRRLYFLLRMIDDLLLGIKSFRGDLSAQDQPGEEEEYARQTREIVWKSGVKWAIPDEQTEKQFVEALSWIKRYLNKAYAELRVRGRKLRARGVALAPVPTGGAELGSHWSALQPLSAKKGFLQGILKNENELQTACQEIETLSLALASRSANIDGSSTGYLRETISLASGLCQEALAIRDLSGEVPSPSEPPPDDLNAVMQSIRDCLSFYYNYYDYFDMLTFPITYATPIGESDVVEVYRISPEDSKGLFNEEKLDRQKLAGTKLWNFGAFFEREWRQNDLLWGKLDGVERILTTLLPESQERLALLLQAWMVILKENLSGDHLQQFRDRLGNAWEYFATIPEPAPEQLADLKDKLVKYFADDYKVDQEFSTEASLNALGRTVQVISKLLDGLEEQYQGVRTPALWLARIGQILVGMMQVAIPGGLSRPIFLHWLKIVYAFELFLIVLGALLGFNNTVMRFGALSLLFTLGVDLGVRFLGNFIKGSTTSAKALRWMTGFALTLVLLTTLVLAILGLVQLGLIELPDVLNEALRYLKGPLQQ